ncbi:GNAT family N-acetyltransferase [Streptomyces carminius]|uniref:GNAT family N-acetyltransferase n=1 Tax=Streptomyces carminius TaxID=2665496 RepID=A0A2M8LTN7_9ACTN|nr:GNAT family N-acetyltransferase [Streptomyces carminius]PJE95322.1 GNAT family N-acetyltransferase [Streptomyces carminius]
MFPSRTLPTVADAAPATLTVRHFGGADLAADATRWAEAYEEVYTQALGLPDHSDPPISERLSRHRERPGFLLTAALEGPSGDAGDPVAGFLYGYTLPAGSLWWDGLTPDPGPEFTREYPNRTVGVCELLVRPRWRRAKVGQRLFEAFLAERREERAAALVAADNEVMLATYAKYGFEPVGRMEPYPGWRPHVMIVRSLGRD